MSRRSIAAFAILFVACKRPADPAVVGPEGPRVPDSVRGVPVEPAAVEKLGEGLVRVGKVCVDMSKRRLEAPGKINLASGILEYLAVGEGGKRHESLLWLDVRPLHFQVGLILLGLHEGDGSVRLWLRVGGEVRPVEQFVWDREKKAEMPIAPWKFVGSTVHDGRFIADDTKSLVATVPDPSAILWTTVERGIPYRGELGFEVHTARTPPVGSDADRGRRTRRPKRRPAALPGESEVTPTPSRIVGSPRRTGPRPRCSRQRPGPLRRAGRRSGTDQLAHRIGADTRARGDAGARDGGRRAAPRRRGFP